VKKEVEVLAALDEISRAFLWQYAPVRVPAPFFQVKKKQLFLMYIV